MIKQKDEEKEKDGVIREKDKASSLKDEDFRGICIPQQMTAKEAECRHSEEVVR